MEIIYRDITTIRKAENNPRTISEEQLQKLQKSIQDNPDYFEARPIILSDRTGELIIIAGSGKVKTEGLWVHEDVYDKYRNNG